MFPYKPFRNQEILVKGFLVKFFLKFSLSLASGGKCKLITSLCVPLKEKGFLVQNKSFYHAG